MCEINLLSKLTELLKSVENFETALKDCTMKAKSKLKNEWTNLKNGYVFFFQFTNLIFYLL